MTTEAIHKRRFHGRLGETDTAVFGASYIFWDWLQDWGLVLDDWLHLRVVMCH
jgi:hypothetical protein